MVVVSIMPVMAAKIKFIIATSVTMVVVLMVTVNCKQYCWRYLL